MRGYRFYEEFDSSYKKRKRRGSGNVLALDIPTRGYWSGDTFLLPCTAAVLSEPDSPVCGTGVSHRVLRKNYRRIPERRAREIHPTMFAFLDQFDENGNRR
jgi:hypothetical protein